MAERKDDIDQKLFLELLFSFGVVEYKRSNFTSSIDAFNSFLGYVDKNKLNLDEDTHSKVNKYIQMADDEIKSKTKKSGGKNAPRGSISHQSRNAKNNSRVYKRLKTVPKEDQKVDVEKLWKDMEANKMDIEEGSKWYVIGMEWFSQWKKWSGFQHISKTISEDVKDSNSNGDDVTKDGEADEPCRIDNYDILDPSEIMLYGE